MPVFLESGGLPGRDPRHDRVRRVPSDLFVGQPGMRTGETLSGTRLLPRPRCEPAGSADPGVSALSVCGPPPGRSRRFAAARRCQGAGGPSCCLSPARWSLPREDSHSNWHSPPHDGRKNAGKKREIQISFDRWRSRISSVVSFSPPRKRLKIRSASFLTAFCSFETLVFFVFLRRPLITLS